MTQFVNLTPHSVFVEGIDGSVTEFAPWGDPVRVVYDPMPRASIRGFRVMSRGEGLIVNLPDPIRGTVYIVSGMVRDALGDTRPDVVSPDTGPDAIRTPNGHIAHVRGFIGV